MALIPCVQCKAMISSDAKGCPKCSSDKPFALDPALKMCRECFVLIPFNQPAACPECGVPDPLIDESAKKKIAQQNKKTFSFAHLLLYFMVSFGIQMLSSPFVFDEAHKKTETNFGYKDADLKPLTKIILLNSFALAVAMGFARANSKRFF